MDEYLIYHGDDCHATIKALSYHEAVWKLGLTPADVRAAKIWRNGRWEAIDTGTSPQSKS